MKRLIITYILAIIVTDYTASQTIKPEVKPYFTTIPTTRSPGLYYENIGNALLSNDHWSFFTYVNYTQYLQALWFVEQEVAQLQSACDALGKDHACHQRSSEVIQRLDSIKETDTALANSLGIKKPTRVKRFWGFLTGLVDSVFGFFGSNRDKKQMEQMERSIGDLRMNQEAMRHEFNAKMTAFDMELQRQNKVQEEMKKDILSIKSTIENLNKELKEVDAKVSKNKQDIDALKISVSMLSVHQHILFLLDKFERDQGKLYESIKKARKNEMDDTILSPAALTGLMRDVMGHLPEGQRFPFHPDIENGKYIIRTIKTDVALYNGLIMFIMETPLVHFMKYTIYKVTSLPVQTEEDGKFAFILPKHPFLLVDAKDNEYTTISSESFKDFCKVVKDGEYLCKQTQWLSKVNVAKDCEAKIFFETAAMPTSCDRRVMQLTQPFYLQLMKPDNWIYVIPNPMDLTIICGKDRQRATLNGTGTISLQKGCSIRMNHVELQYVKEFTANVSSIYIPTKMNLSVDLSKHDTVPVDHSTAVILPFELQDLKHISAGISDAISSRRRILITSIVSTITLLALIVLVIVLFRKRVTYWVRRKLGYADEDRLQLRVKVNNKDEKLCRVSVSEKPSENDPGADYVTVRFKVKKQNENANGDELQKLMLPEEPDLNVLRKMKPTNGPNADELRKLKPKVMNNELNNKL